ncbi:MAG TPA: two-component regulator propeller domain-containing protein [Puia sp.]|nr:two-component regulator propeller domain-containing protein [Puia sp.]
MSAQTPFRFAHIDFSSGLSNNQVNAIFKDARGFMWFGTMSGLNRYDGYQFRVFRHNLADTNSLNDDYISRICEDPFRKLWVQTRNGYNIYDPETEQFNRKIYTYLQSLSLPSEGFSDVVQTRHHFWLVYSSLGICYLRPKGKPVFLKHAANDPGSIDADPVSDICEDSKGNSWLIHQNGLLEQLDSQHLKVIFRSTVFQDRFNGRSFASHLFIDNGDNIWAYSMGNIDGVYQFQPNGNRLLALSKKTRPQGLNNDLVNGITMDCSGKIWIGTDHGGINVYDRKTGSLQFITNTANDAKSLAQNCVTTLYRDPQGGVWAGTYKDGISYYHEDMVKFPWYHHLPGVANSLPYDDVNRFVEDANGNLWIGTNGGGLIYFDRKKNQFQRFQHDPNNSNSLSNNVVVSMWLDHRHILWIGTYFGGLDSYDGKHFVHYRHNEARQESLADDRVWEIYEDSKNNLWVGTLEGGLDKFDREKKIFIHHRTSIPNSLHSDYISALAEDKYSNLWIGTSYGIDVAQLGGVIVHYSAANQLSNENIIAILKDHAGNMWVGTREGLNVFNSGKQSFQSFRTEDGLPDNAILTIVEDNSNHLWVTTPNGISQISVHGDQAAGFKINCRNYNETDGLQGREFNENAALKTGSGELVFGGANGVNIFNPDQIKNSRKNAPVVLTDFQIFNKTIHPNTSVNGKLVLDKSISETQQISLKYNQRVFSIEFASLLFVNTDKTRYAYKLEGFDHDWLVTDGISRRATYTNLDPGKYIFRVKASNDHGLWTEMAMPLVITILPPFWKTPLAYLCYLFLLVGLLVFARRMIIQRARMRFALEQERREAQRMHELDMMKIKFFTNVSHEFRTPLSLILSPLERIIRASPDAIQKNQLNLVHRNARRLLNLVNQLLDFRKMEVQELKLNPVKGEIVRFIREVCYSFTDLAEQKNIKFSFESDIDQLYCNFDYDKIERILFNLLSNAFKFTLEKGKVDVAVAARRKGAEMDLEIRVRDTGIGIPPEKLDKIFDRFFQQEVPGTLVNQGSGIGLSITKEFIRLHQGNIKVESEPEKGSCFTVHLPFKEFETIFTGEPLRISHEPEAVTMVEPVAALVMKGKDGRKQPLILLVEDNEDFRFYLKDNLRSEFRIVEAVNGKEGWQKALSAQPDLVVTDISMPLMNGIELCKKIKADPRTEQIPVILLTALTGEEDQLRGLETGASDYITKPFNFEVMVSRIKNILTQQVALKKTYSRKVEAKPTENPVGSGDDRFVRQALEIVEKNLSDPDFSVEDLSQALFMSRISVYKRLLSLTGKTPIEFIRSIRLDHAAVLLEKSQLTVAEIAYEVGFNNPKYFTKYFKAAFNMLPSAYSSAKKKESGAV